jgi:hypothetical protein
VGDASGPDTSCYAFRPERVAASDEHNRQQERGNVDHAVQYSRQE